MDELFPLLVILLVVVAPIWIAFHYITIWKKHKPVSSDDQDAKIRHLEQTARRMRHRLDALEAILDAEVPDWRHKT
ncbi:envelope stress response membrane protein PspB [Abyssibacter profundi]|uniref:Envelope stress response membrane protein PspB n=1 Tax=Abyssibacter profundi TaxID=2182787 RepID=A0A363UNZ2_9GAMM|nr:envelope stress response membrane protein PspB [Abyssibacter profundi]MBV60210.1 envelope stress response membrane protein PspB [Nevskiales bacterium]PWN57125.1 envelope stress response membrane protein PspB [Abyssibacter profundi]